MLRADSIISRGAATIMTKQLLRYVSFDVTRCDEFEFWTCANEGTRLVTVSEAALLAARRRPEQLRDSGLLGRAERSATVPFEHVWSRLTKHALSALTLRGRCSVRLKRASEPSTSSARIHTQLLRARPAVGWPRPRQFSFSAQEKSSSACSCCC